MADQSTRGPSSRARVAPGDLLDAFLALRTRADAEAFLVDLCTPGEIKALRERWQIARLLDAAELSYREVAARAGSSTATVVRVARFLKSMPHKGYRRVLDRLKGAKR